MNILQKTHFSRSFAHNLLLAGRWSCSLRIYKQSSFESQTELKTMTGVATSKLHAGKTVALLGPFSGRTTWNNNWSKDIDKLPRIDWWLPNDVIGYMIRSLHFCARFFSGEGRGSSSSDGLEIAHSQKLSEIVLLAPNQAGTKQGRRYSHFNWSLEQLWAALSRRCSQQDLPRVILGTFWTRGGAVIIVLCNVFTPTRARL